MSSKPSQPVNTARRIVFFDLDGTLHREDMFGSFLRFLLKRMPLNLLLVIPLLPIVALGLLMGGRALRWPMSLLLWSMTFGRSEASLKEVESQFVSDFRHTVTAFPAVQMRLRHYLEAPDTQVWLITGSPEQLVTQVYHDAEFLPQVCLVGSQMARRYGGWVLPVRCLGRQKVVQLEQRLGVPLQLFSGYSDSKQDDPLLSFCQHRWRINKQGELLPLK